MISFIQEQLFFSNLIVYDVLILAVISALVFGAGAVSNVLLLIGVGLGYYFKIIDPIGLAVIFILSICCYLYKHKELNKISSFAIVSIIITTCFGILFHKIPGFSNIKLINSIHISPESAQYSLWLNFDKVVMGLIVLLFATNYERLRAKKIKTILKLSVLGAGCFLALFYIASLIPYISQFISYDFKVPDISTLWLVNMVFFVVFAEEVIFRGFIQKGIYQKLGKLKYKASISIIITSTIFALVHFPMGVQFMGLAFLASIIYGFVYYKSGSIHSAILTHSLVNALHFFLYSYPYKL